MNLHLVWLWIWFFVGAATYWLKRAYYLVTGPNPVANTYGEFIRRCWIPILVRAFIDAMTYWMLFFPGPVEHVITYLGWQSYDWAVHLVTQFAPFSAIFGHAIDSVVDFGVSKVPFVKDWLPQMPPPIKTGP